VFPSADRETDVPCLALVARPVGSSNTPPVPLHPANVHPGAGFAVSGIGVPTVNPRLQLGAVPLVTLPAPLGFALTASEPQPTDDWVKFAVTVVLPAIVKVVVGDDVVENEPPLLLHPTNVHPNAGLAASTACEPCMYPPVQFCSVSVVTLPAPAGLTSSASVSHAVVCSRRFAVTVAEAAIVNVVSYAATFENDPPLPLHPAKVHPVVGVKERETRVPGRYPPVQVGGVFTTIVPSATGATAVARATQGGDCWVKFAVTSALP
jgi:hypothetical protein